MTEVSKIRRRVPVEEYLRRQKRYAHLLGDPGHPDIVARIQAGADRNIERFGLLADEPAGPGAAEDSAADVPLRPRGAQ